MLPKRQFLFFPVKFYALLLHVSTRLKVGDVLRAIIISVSISFVELRQQLASKSRNSDITLG